MCSVVASFFFSWARPGSRNPHGANSSSMPRSGKARNSVAQQAAGAQIRDMLPLPTCTRRATQTRDAATSASPAPVRYTRQANKGRNYLRCCIWSCTASHRTGTAPAPPTRAFCCNATESQRGPSKHEHTLVRISSPPECYYDY
ncbi:hypothetical protein M441DRAFT_451489 [Trichoderma asperellum CBS 433.97]|uniref:Uncharacterized protein n=1 Tax=Trichoderma asperellum (strain ATCC 204424 / CBS 433.97 / NBRC 101777) TaxID=1042311 RepID=A0A2T3ZKM1_TRIA4|nr:hypothetical protein M441DRAFT_451489 [Trichoderma asperellum CBS 433.97]PTB45354.1 hypothetical protein M441DRAFT_451489 [Trichoderma asperellum CBS 433.97]